MPPEVLSFPEFVQLIYIEQEILGCSCEYDWTPLVEYHRTGVLPQWAINKMKAKENR